MNLDELIRMEEDSKRAFVERSSRYLAGRVLDFGCGRQPYRDVVEAAGGEYHPFDRTSFVGSIAAEDYGPEALFRGLGDWEAILCTQVIQFVVERPDELLWRFARALWPGGYLVMTYPTHWPENGPEDLRRFTESGMNRLLTEAGFQIVTSERRAVIEHDGFQLALGYGVVARST